MIVGKECTSCKVVKPLDDFFTGQCYGGKDSMCKKCKVAAHRQYHTGNPHPTPNNGEYWSQRELDIILEHDGPIPFGTKKSYAWKLSTRQAAMAVGRTMYAVEVRRSAFLNDPSKGMAVDPRASVAPSGDTRSTPPLRNEVLCGSCFMMYNDALGECPDCGESS